MKASQNPSLNHPRWVIWLSVFITAAILLLALLPSVYPEQFPYLNGLKVDTDPENMLDDDEPSRVFHRERRKEFTLHDTVVLGVLEPERENGVFNVETLRQVYEITEHAEDFPGVIASDIMAPSTVDNIEQGGAGSVSFNWLMPEPPETEEEALAVRDKMMNLPMMRGSLVSEEGKALMLYFPIERKDMSYDLSQSLKEKIKSFPDGGAEYHITGLPVANDTFGVEMFIQMAISAPTAMVLIFLLMWFFFRRFTLIISPMILAVMSVIITMGALIVSGNTVHIMSSMIPIFIMPIAVLDAVHILSDFYDKYPYYKNKRETIIKVLDELWRPMLFTSLTTAAGFGSLALAPIPPVQVFGIFVAFGVLVAWFLTVTFIPAYILLMPEKWLKDFGFRAKIGGEEIEHPQTRLARFGALTTRKAKVVLGITIVLSGVAAYGISLIVINDNPVKWFEKDHEIRIADRKLNERFGGTYPAYLVLDTKGEKDAFKKPEYLNYISELQTYLEKQETVGKTIALPTLVKTIYRELMSGDEEYFRIPDQANGVAQTLLTYESSHRPDDLWHFATPDYSKATIWFQLKSGDNNDMISVVESVDKYIEANPFPVEMSADWFGLTYINVVWQDKMVKGMLQALLSSFIIVFILMTLLFRSPLWGLLSMVPLSVTIAFIYGVIGLVGKNYDMPVAVLSSLSLGLSIDYAIHFLVRSRQMHRHFDSWKETVQAVFGEPARAITRNIIVVGVGFLPLILAPLVPYQTVGYLISAILVTAGFGTLVILPALMTLLHRYLFRYKYTISTK